MFAYIVPRNEVNIRALPYHPTGRTSTVSVGVDGILNRSYVPFHVIDVESSTRISRCAWGRHDVEESALGGGVCGGLAAVRRLRLLPVRGTVVPR